MSRPVLRVTQHWGSMHRPVCPYCGTKEISIFSMPDGDFCIACIRARIDEEPEQVADGQGDLFGGDDGASAP